MFSYQTIKLSELSNDSKLDKCEFVRDCDVSFVGKVPTHLPNRIIPITKLSHLREAQGDVPEGITGVITDESLAESVPADWGLIISENPLQTFYKIHQLLTSLENFQWTSFESKIHPTAQVHPSAYVAERDVVIGAGSIIHPRAVVLERTIIGASCSVGPCSVVGVDAYEIITVEGIKKLIPSFGGVILEDDVDVLSCTTIARPAFGGFTSLGRGSKVDNLVHIAHDVRLGKNVSIVACSEISGRVTMGDNSYVGPNSTVSNGLTFGENSYVTLGSVVVRDVPEDTRVTGNFAVPHRKWIEFVKSITRD